MVVRGTAFRDEHAIVALKLRGRCKSAAFRRSSSRLDVLREIELIGEPKQFATRRPSPRHVVGAGEFRRKFLLPENEDFKFGYRVHSVPLLSS